jgi:hypothetical protein
MYTRVEKGFMDHRLTLTPRGDMIYIMMLYSTVLYIWPSTLFLVPENGQAAKVGGAFSTTDMYL